MSAALHLADSDPRAAAGLEALARAAGASLARVPDAASLAGLLEGGRPALLFVAAGFPGARESFSALSPRVRATLLLDPADPPPAELPPWIQEAWPRPRNARSFALLHARATRGLGLLLERAARDAAETSLVEDGASPAARRLREQVERVAATPDTTLFVTGPPGSGKAAVARAVHRRSARRGGPFLRVACRRREALVEQELFGDGLLPGGALEAPSGGTVLLDEVGLLAPPLQERLVAVLAARAESDSLRGRGARLVAATARALEDEARAGRFPEDLLYRLNVLSLDVPPLSAAPGDATRLARAFLARQADGSRGPATLSEPAARLLEEHPWPGGVAELEATLARALAVAPAGVLEPAHLWPAADPTGGPAPAPARDRSLRAREEAWIRRVLREEQGNRSRVARVLGIHRATLYNKLRLYGIEDEPAGGG